MWLFNLHVYVPVHVFMCMWQSRVEIEGYSVVYFDRIAVFEAHMSPTLHGSSAIWCFKGSDGIEIRDRITFDFYTGLPHMQYV